MTEIDAVRLHFAPESLIALDVILAFVLFGVALDMEPADFAGIAAAPRATVIEKPPLLSPVKAPKIAKPAVSETVARRPIAALQGGRLKKRR